MGLGSSSAQPNAAFSARGVADSSSGGKFWAVEVVGSELTTHWGKVGTDGSSKTKEMGSEEKALKEAQKLVKSAEVANNGVPV